MLDLKLNVVNPNHQLVPPFSVFDARTGPWQNRKKFWIGLGIKSEMGRGDNALGMPDTCRSVGKKKGLAQVYGDAHLWGKRKKNFINGALAQSDTGYDPQFYIKKRTVEMKLGRTLTTEEFHDKYYTPIAADSAIASGTSIFDPVLCEHLFNWFCPKGGQIVDPFAGGSVRGVVAAMCGRKYWGCDLRPEQIKANNEQAKKICPDVLENLEWVTGDSRETVKNAPEADFAFSCHPSSVRVLTETRGPVPIDEIVVGERVFSHTGKLRTVTECLNRNYTGTLLSIVRDFRRGIPLLVTKEHPLLIKRLTPPTIQKTCACGCGESSVGGFYKRGHNNKHHSGRWGTHTKEGERTRASIRAHTTEYISWVTAEHVRKGDFLLEPMPQIPETLNDERCIWEYIPEPRKQKRRKPIGPTSLHASEKLCLLLGYYLAEGWCSDYDVRFAFHEKETKYHDDIVTIWKAIFGGATITQQNSGGSHGVTIRCNGVTASQFFSTAGKGASKKALPQWVWGCSNKQVAEVIKGAWRGDGWVDKEGLSFGFASVSEKLVEDLRRALLRFGIIASVRCRPARSSAWCALPKPQWNLTVKGAFAIKMGALLGEKTAKLPYRRPGRGPYIADGYVHYKVQHIKSTQVENLPVYNLEVTEDHSFIADGIVSHNCPPYGDLEKYGDDPRDLANMAVDDFDKTHGEIIEKTCARLKNNRFACWVISEYRGKDGNYAGFVPNTIWWFEKAGLRYYNEAILINPVGSLHIRVNKQFSTSRKLGRTHQNILMFVKGDPKIASKTIVESEAS